MLRLHHGIRSLPLLALPDGTYVVTDGDEVRTLTIDDFDPVRWLTLG